MTLLSPLALWFGLFALVPLVLHLYQRRRRNVILFSTNRFFTESIVEAQRRLRLRHLLLLLLRLAVCALLAAALARPMLNWMDLTTRSGRRDLVILLDDSLSMQARPRRPGAVSRFEAARTIAGDALGRLKAGDRAAVLTFTGRALARQARTGAALTNDLTQLRSQVAGLAPTSAPGDAHRALGRAAQLFEHDEQRTAAILILTDLQAGDWRRSHWPQPDVPIGALLVALPGPTHDNLVLEQAVVSQTAAVVGQPSLLRVRMRNQRDAQAEADLVLTVDDQIKARRRLALLGLSPLIEQMPIVFDSPGEHRLTVALDGPDALPVDNAYHLVLHVEPDLPVLLVDGDAGQTQRRTAGFYLRTALAAAGAARTELHTALVAPADLPAVALDEYRVVVLSNVERLPPAELERLEQFVADGGGLAVFPGDAVAVPFYNDVVGADSRPHGGLLPARLGDLVDTGDATEALHLTSVALDHPLLQRFKGPLRSALAGVDVTRAYTLTPRTGWVLASLTDRLPLMVEHSFGRGRVILFATAPQPDWTNLPMRRVFVPLVNRLIGYLAGSGAPAVADEVGSELVLLRGGWDYQEPLNVRRPDGTACVADVRLRAAAPQAYLAPGAADQVGFYELPAPPKGRSWRRLRAVNAPRRESLVPLLDMSILAEQAGQWRVRAVDAGDADLDRQIAALLTSEHAGRAVWDMLLWTVLALVILEPLFANWTGRWLSRGARRESN